MTAAPLLLHVFPTFRAGGSQLRFAAIANHFAGGYRHAVLAMDGRYDCLARLSAGVDVQTWDIFAPKKNTIPNVLKFRRVLHARKPDLLVTYNWGALEWAFANRPRVVPHLHIEDGFGPEEAQRQFRRRVLARRFALANSLVVVPSQTLCDIALNLWRLPKERVRHIPNGIDVARFAAVSNPIEAPVGTGPVIGTVAALRPEKNIARLLRAVHAVQKGTPCRLIVAGDGPERLRLQAMANELLASGSFLFLGNVDAVERVYATLDIFALSSDTEQMSTSLMEAMAAGLPVVSTNVGDVARMVAAENRPFIVGPDEVLFSDALSRMVREQRMRSDLGAANRSVANVRFGAEKMYSEYDSLFLTLIESAYARALARKLATASGHNAE
ncbi:MAG TPA: glycosyltransferase family 4 protein [Rhizomicrobium sp.]|nr:glycosyltransferase family 4 protein [Rhizomicrobium sp.]